MNTFRALIFGATIATVLTITMNTVTAGEPLEVIHLDTVYVTAHK